MSSPVRSALYVQKKAEILEQIILAIPSASVLLDEDGLIIAANSPFNDFAARYSQESRRDPAGVFFADVLPINRERFSVFLRQMRTEEDARREVIIEIRKNVLRKEPAAQWRIVASCLKESYLSPQMILLIEKPPSKPYVGAPFHEGVPDSEREKAIRNFYSELSSLFHTDSAFRSIVAEIFGKVERQFNCICSLRIFNENLFPVINDNLRIEITDNPDDKKILLHRLDGDAKTRCAAQCKRHERDHTLNGENDDLRDVAIYKSRGYTSVFFFPVTIEGEDSGGIIIAMKPNPHVDREIVMMGEFLARNLNGILEKNYHFFARLEAEKKQAEIQHLAEKLSRLASKGVMVSAITHDINNSLGVIKFSAENALYAYRRNNAAIPEFVVNKLVKIEESMQSIEERLRHVRSFWIEPDQVKNRMVNLDESVRQVFSVLEKDMENNGIDVIIESSSDSLFIYGNAVQIGQIVSNLVVNAAQALQIKTAGDKKIILSSFRKDRRIFLQVRDTGPGLSAEVLKRMSESSIPVVDSNRSNGLGLPIVRYFVEGHGGIITAENHHEGGALFTISFPFIEHRELPDENSAC